MTGKRPTGLFITGTNTGVGKTFFAAALARTLVATGRRVGVYKPVLSGCRRDDPSFVETNGSEITAENDSTDDDVRLWLAAGRPGELSQVSPQRFRAPLAPNLAAEVEGRTVDTQLLRTGIQPWLAASDMVIVEGAGGLFSPLTENELNADLAYDFGFPIVLVAANALGTIHATLATWLAARSYRDGLNIVAVVLNDIPSSSDMSRTMNLDELKRRCAPCPVIPHGHNESRVSKLDWLLEEIGTDVRR